MIFSNQFKFEIVNIVLNFKFYWILGFHRPIFILCFTSLGLSFRLTLIKAQFFSVTKYNENSNSRYEPGHKEPSQLQEEERGKG